MITLKDLIDLAGTVTLLEVNLRHEDGKLIKHYDIGLDVHITPHMRDDMDKGRREVIEARINKYLDADKIRAKMEPTQFKKGERSRNYLPVGTVTTNSYGYVIRKISDEGAQWERWEFVHRRTWEDANGPVPEGMMIIFRDGNRQNCDLSNLMLISKSDNASLNKLGLRSTDPDLLDVGINLVHIKRAAKDAKKRKK